MSLLVFLEYVFAIGPSQHSLLLYVIINKILCAGSFSWSMYLTMGHLNIAACICDNYPNLMSWLVFLVYIFDIG